MYTTQASMKLVDSDAHGEGAELFIVEGDSAARSVAILRDARTQAVLPLQGKPLNAWKASAAKVAAAPLYRQLSAALGTRNATTCEPADPGGLRFGRIVLLFDPDADGIHIGALMLLYFQRWMPALISQGRILMVRAPMFALTCGDEPPSFAYSTEHAQAIAAQWRAEGRGEAQLHRFLGLGSIPPATLHALCIDPATRLARTVGEADIAAVKAALGIAPVDDATH